MASLDHIAGRTDLNTHSADIIDIDYLSSTYSYNFDSSFKKDRQNYIEHGDLFCDYTNVLNDIE